MIDTYKEFLERMTEADLEPEDDFEESEGKYYIFNVKTEKTTYFVKFSPSRKDEYEITLFDDQDRLIVNEGAFWKVFKNIAGMIIKFVKKHNPKILYFSGMMQNSKDKEGELSQRTRIYLNLLKDNLKKFFPDATYKNKNNIIYIHFK